MRSDHCRASNGLMGTCRDKSNADGILNKEDAVRKDGAGPSGSMIDQESHTREQKRHSRAASDDALSGNCEQSHAVMPSVSPRMHDRESGYSDPNTVQSDVAQRVENSSATETARSPTLGNEASQSDGAGRFNKYSTAKEPVFSAPDATLVRRWSKHIRKPFRRGGSVRRKLSTLASRRNTESAPSSPQEKQSEDHLERRVSFDHGRSRSIRRLAVRQNEALAELVDADGLHGRADYPVLEDPRLFSGLFAPPQAKDPLPERTDATHAALSSAPSVAIGVGGRKGIHAARISASASDAHLVEKRKLLPLVEHGTAQNSTLHIQHTTNAKVIGAQNRRHEEALRRFNSLLSFEAETRRMAPETTTELATSRAVLRHIPRTASRASHHQGTVALTDKAAVFQADSGAPQLCFAVPWTDVVGVQLIPAASGLVLHTNQIPVVLVEIPDVTEVRRTAENAMQRVRSVTVAGRKEAYLQHARRLAKSPIHGVGETCGCGERHAETAVDILIPDAPPAAVISRLLGEGCVPFMGRGALYAALSEGAAVIGDTGWRGAIRHVRSTSLSALSDNAAVDNSKSDRAWRHKRSASMYASAPEQSNNDELLRNRCKSVAVPASRNRLPAETITSKGSPQRAVWVNVPEPGGQTLRLEFRLRHTQSSPDRSVVDGVLRIRPGVAAGVAPQPKKGAVALRWCAARAALWGPTRLRVTIEALELDTRLPGAQTGAAARLLGLARGAIVTSLDMSPHSGTLVEPEPDLPWTWRTSVRAAYLFVVQPIVAEMLDAPRSSYAAAAVILLATLLWIVLCRLGIMCSAQYCSAPRIEELDEALRLDSAEAVRAALKRLISDRQH